VTHVLNVLFYVPAASLVSAIGWPVSAGIVTGAAMSLIAEGVQVFSRDRSPDGNDLVANIGGAAAGAGAVSIYRRRSARRLRNT
jgi:glycopeptide antibiotics resistance protein